MTRKQAILATAAAALFTAGLGGSASAAHHEGGEKIHCEGVNGCKGQSGCATDHSACAGQNSCKGKGWVEMTQDECDTAKAAMHD